MRNLSILSAVVLTTAALAASLGAAGCSVDTADASQMTTIHAGADAVELPADARVNCVLVMGANVSANTEPTGSLPEGAHDALAAAMSTGGKMDIVTAEGEPRGFGMTRMGSDTADAGIRAEENEQALAQLEQGIAGGALAATSEEVDIMGSITYAGRELASAETEDSFEVMAVCASMVSTAGAVDFTDGVSLASDPSAVCAWLEQTGSVIDLASVDLVLVYYTGDVAGDQAALPNADIEGLKAIWSGVLSACGAADVRFLPDKPAESDLDVSGLPSVTPVAVSETTSFAELAIESGTVIGLGEAERIMFVPDQATFLDEEAARATLGELAARLIEADARVAIEGSTANDDTPEAHESLIALSQSRAQAVADALVDAGLDRASIVSVTGVGSGDGAYIQHVDDTDENGLVEELAKENRKVVVAVV